MADLSLDDYIATKNSQFGASQRGNMGKGGPQPQFTVTGLGKVQGNFDARQKISGPGGGIKDARQKITHGPAGGIKDARQKITHGPQGGIKDARQKIMQKTKFVDARVRIQSKKGQPGSVDARQLINPKKQSPQAATIKPQQPKQFMHPAPGGTKVLVTGVGRMLAQGNSNVMTTPQGTLFKTIQATEPPPPPEQAPVMMWDESYDPSYVQNFDPNPPMGYDPNIPPPNYQTPAGFPPQLGPPTDMPPPMGYAPQGPWMEPSYDMQQGYAPQPMWSAPPPQPMPITRTIGQSFAGRADQPVGRKKLLITTTNKKVKPQITPITPPVDDQDDEPEPPPPKTMIRTVPAAASRQPAKPKMIRTTTAPRTNVADRIAPRTAIRKPISAGPLRAAAEPPQPLRLRKSPAQPLRLRTSQGEPLRLHTSSAPVRRTKPSASIASRLQPAEPVMSRLKPAPAATRPSLFSRGAGTVVKVRNELYREEMEEEAQYEEEVEYEEDYPIEEEEEEEEVEYVAVRKKLPTTTQKSRLAIKPTIVQRAASPPPLPVADVISPLQGFRVLLTNLHHIVSEDDLTELFGTVGALKKVKLVRPGTAEIVFHKKDEAMSAIRKYHMRELDGQPMHLVLAQEKSAPAPSMAPLRSKSAIAQSAGLNTAQELAAVSAAAAAVSAISGRGSSGPLRLGKDTAAPATDKPKADIDPGLIHKALFKTATKGDPPARPVSFTVKI